MEYAAIESRLEAICGIIGLPCGKDCHCRKDIMISTRIDCMRAFKHTNPSVFEKSKLPQNIFTRKGTLNNWIDKRNRIVHGLYKDELRYTGRVQNSQELAEKGYEYVKLLYNEAKRIRRIKANHPDVFDCVIVHCENTKCQGYNEE